MKEKYSMRVLLIQPDQNGNIGLQRMGRVEPLGLEMIAGALQEAHEVDILDLRMAPQALTTTLADFRPDLVGISSTFTTDIYKALSVAETVKAADPRTFVFVGGHHPSLYPEDFNHSALDAIVAGEGEVTAQELVNCLAANGNPARVHGLVLNRPDGQHFSGRRALVKPLDVLPHPQRALTRSHGWTYDLGLSGPLAAVETARGCPYKCNFCSVWRFYEGRVRFKSPQRMVEELQAVEESAILFTDDNFLASVRRAAQIADLIEERGIHKHYIIQARSDAIARHPDVIARWVSLGLMAVFVGFEKPDQAGLEQVNKHNSVENNEQALAVLRDHSIEPVVSFIVHPNYTYDDFAILKAYVHRLKLWQAAFSVLTPLPGTPLYDDLKDQLTTHNYELWDLMHVVLPTRLPLREFYQELTSLYRCAYPRWKLLLGKAYLALQRLRGNDVSEQRQMLAEILRLRDPRVYLSR
jgi:radical SAM superfamily enzyme YgiQ (UPF0313 family)